jgi:hypothetical protein
VQTGGINFPEMPSVDAQHKKEIILLASSTQQQKFITFSSGEEQRGADREIQFNQLEEKHVQGRNFLSPKLSTKLTNLLVDFTIKTPKQEESRSVQ